ncbi:T3SS effector HopA1 family protein [Amycolatopsis solani]|uniref:T3SS effector HopA1 family protein n=1 Tax=Amycolatopsis solani TaxID=3028615 RepID=UPI0025B22287|nr:T3SS effector HopA1 family protein [Amycolatopsis sp. MEP2-6]
MLDVLRELDVDVREDEVAIAGQMLETPTGTALRAQLAAALYDRLHVGGTTASPEAPGFSSRLAAAVPHEFTRVSGRVVSRSGADDVVVEIEGVRVRVPASRTTARSAGEFVSIDIGCTRPSLAPGFFLVDGSAGHGLVSGDHTLRVYAHLVEPSTATAAWRAILVSLEQLRVPFRAKISLHLPRRDALVLYLGREAWPCTTDIVDALTSAPGLGRSVSVYAHQLADGVAAAWDPADVRPGYRGLSFGEHRSRAIADALLAPGAPEEELARSLERSNVDATGIFRNLNSPAL